nr:hypothetical protein [Tanacetum cinerariifolium]
MTLSSQGDAKVFEEPHHHPASLLECVLQHTTAPATKGALILLPTPDEVAVAQPDPFLKRKLRKRVSEVGSSNPKVEQTEGLGDGDISSFWVELEDSLKRSDSIPVRVVSAPLPHLGSTTSSFAGKLGFKDVRRCSDPLDTLARSTLSRDAEYDQISKDDFATASRGEEIDMTFFPLAPGPYFIPYPLDDPDVCKKALDQTITPAEIKRTKSLLSLELSNRVNILSALLGDAKVFEEPHHHPASLLECVLQHTTAPATKGALILLPTPDEVAVAQPDPFLKRKLRKRVSEVGSSNPKVEQTEGLGDGDISSFWVELEDSLKRSDSIPVRVVSAPLPHLGSTTSSFAGKLGFKDVRRCSDPLDTLARSTLSRDAEYDQISKDDFATASRGEEIDMTFFPLAPGPYFIPYPLDDPDVCKKALDQTITPAEIKRTKSLLSLELSNRVNILSALLVSHGMEFNTRYTNLVASKARTKEELKRKSGYVKDLRDKELCSQNDVSSEELKSLQAQLTDAKASSERLTDKLARTDAKLFDRALVVRNLLFKLSLERSKSRECKDVADGLRAEVSRFVGSGVECLV